MMNSFVMKGMMLFCLGMNIFSMSCKRHSQETKAKLILFEADWCFPCKELKNELSKAGITDTWHLKLDHCSLDIPIMKANFSDSKTTEKNPERKYKKTDMFPEQAFLWKEKLIANDNYSNLLSVEGFLKSTFQKLES